MARRDDRQYREYLRGATPPAWMPHPGIMSRTTRSGHQLSSRRQTACRRRPSEVHMGVLLWILFGLIVGALAKLLMPGRDPGGIIVTMLIGIVGAMIGGFIGRVMGLYGPNQAAGLFMSIIGAMLLLFIYRKLAV